MQTDWTEARKRLEAWATRFDRGADYWGGELAPYLRAALARIDALEADKREELKTAYVTGAQDMARYAGLPTDDLDEAGYDYAAAAPPPPSPAGAGSAE